MCKELKICQNKNKQLMNEDAIKINLEDVEAYIEKGSNFLSLLYSNYSIT